MADSKNKIFTIIQENLEQEVGTLLDQDFTLNKKEVTETTKDKFVNSVKALSSKSVLTSIKVEDDIGFQAYILMSLRDAVRLGCILIMLPEEEIAKRIKAKTLEGEDADAFNEIVNIFAGVFSNSYQQSLAKNIHFKKDSVQVVSAQETETLSQIAEETNYIQGSYTIVLGKQELSYLELLMPEDLLLSKEEVKEKEKEDNQQTRTEVKTEEPGRDVRLDGDERSLLASEFSESEEKEVQTQQGAESEPELEYVDEKHVQETLNHALPEIAQDLGDLLGQNFSIADISFGFISKEEYCAQRRSKWVLTRFSISGEMTGQGNFLCSLKDALYLGGNLLMMPEKEITQLSKRGVFEGEIADSFGEISNIVVGTCSNIFYDKYPKKIHFKREEIEAFSPAKDESQDKIAEGMYYLVSGNMYLDETVLGNADFLFPLGSLGLKKPQQEAVQEDSEQQKVLKKGDYQEGAVGQPVEFEEEFAQEQEQPLVYVVLNDDQQRAIFNDCLKHFDEFSLHIVSLDNFFKEKKDKRKIYGAFLVLDKVDDYGLAYVIQIKAKMASKSPLILAGPQWTRSDVIKAFRYGARDILVTPLEDKDIRQKFEKHIYSKIKAKQ